VESIGKTPSMAPEKQKDPAKGPGPSYGAPSMGGCLGVEVPWRKRWSLLRAGGKGVVVRRGLEEARGETWVPRYTNRVEGVLVGSACHGG
jgi:hypothetical protein